VTRAEFVAKVAERAEYHEAIGDVRVAGALRMVLADCEALNGIPARAADRLISLEDAAGRLSVSVRWLRENRPSYVVELSPKMLKVSERRLNAWLKRS
jgi:hypothetical protein